MNIFSYIILIMSQKKITIFYDADYVSMEGGGQKRLYEIARKLLENKNNLINWITFKFWKNPSNYFEQDDISYVGIIKQPKFYDENGSRNTSEPVLYLINCLLCIPYFLRSNILIIGQWPLLHIIPVVIIGLILRKEIYVEWWETLQEQWLKRGVAGKVGAFIERLIISLSSYVTFVVECESEKELILKINKKAKVKIIQNGVDLKDYPIAPGKKDFDFISLGRLVSQKNIDTVIEAIEIVRKDFKDVSLCIIGDGPEKENIKKQIHELKLEKNILMTGFLDSEIQKMSYINRSRVGLIIQDGVGKGNVVVNEMLAAGLPVIAAGTINGIDKNYIIENEDGYFINNINPQELAEKMFLFLNEPSTLDKMQQNLFSKQESFSWSYTLSKYPILVKEKNV